MEREELINFIRENLTINLTTDRCYDYNDEYINVTVSLSLNNEGQEEIISSCNDTIHL